MKFGKYICDKRFVVPDIIHNTPPKYIFIFESPAETELKTGSPLMGLAGKHMLTALQKNCKIVSGAKSFGEFVLFQQFETAILNVCPVPLDPTNLLFHKKIFDSNWSLAKNPRKTYFFNDQKLEYYIYKNFSDRLKNVLENSNENMRTLILCGNMAQFYADKIIEENALHEINKINLRHPIAHKGNLSEQEIKDIKPYLEEISFKPAFITYQSTDKKGKSITKKYEIEDVLDKIPAIDFILGTLKNGGLKIEETCQNGKYNYNYTLEQETFNNSGLSELLEYSGLREPPVPLVRARAPKKRATTEAAAPIKYQSQMRRLR